MAAFDCLTLMALYNSAKQKSLSGHERSVVYIKGKKLREEQLQAYKDICTLFNHGKFMSWGQLYHLLRAKMKDTVIVLEVG